MEYLTLQELCGLAGVTRRAVQGYEKAGLVSAAGKNKRGHLLYAVGTQDRIRQIRLLQRIGFSIREIGELMELPVDAFRMKVKERTEMLMEKKAEIDRLILEAARLMEKM